MDKTPATEQLLAAHSRYARLGATEAQWMALAARFEIAAQRGIARPLMREMMAECLGRAGLSVADVAA